MRGSWDDLLEGGDRVDAAALVAGLGQDEGGLLLVAGGDDQLLAGLGLEGDGQDAGHAADLAVQADLADEDVGVLAGLG